MSTRTTDPWWELLLTVPTSLADDVGAMFITEGALGAEQISGALPAPSFDQGGATREPIFGDETTLRVSFLGALSHEEIASRAAQALEALGLAALPTKITKREDVDWSERWKEFFHPLAAGPRLWVVPAWRQDFEVPALSVAVVIDPGLAFGTGQHATTALCLELFDLGLLEGQPKPRVLDVGCGSGILAIAAAKLGCTHVVAIDNDPTAVSAAIENIERNRVEDRISTSATPLGEVRGAYDFVLANLVTPVLVELACELVARVAEGGSLLVSGILEAQEEEVTQALASACAKAERSAPVLVDRRARDGWVALRLSLGGLGLDGA